jgi:hypothetical protein
MMKTIQKNVAVDSSIERIFTIIKVLLAVSPFMALGYLTAKGGASGNIQTILSQNPHYTVMFLVAMVNPFIAYLLGFLQEHLNKNDYGYAVVNMALMIVAEAMLQNILYVAVLIFLLYKIIRTYRIPVKDSVESSLKNHFLRDISGSIVVLIFSGICMFAMMQLR